MIVFVVVVVVLGSSISIKAKNQTITNQYYVLEHLVQLAAVYLHIYYTIPYNLISLMDLGKNGDLPSISVGYRHHPGIFLLFFVHVLLPLFTRQKKCTMREAHFLSSCKNILGGGNCYYIILLPFTSFTIFVVVSVNANHMMHICKQPSQKHKLEWVVYFFFFSQKKTMMQFCAIFPICIGWFWTDELNILTAPVITYSGFFSRMKKGAELLFWHH